MQITMNMFFRFFIFFLAHAASFALQAGVGVVHHPSIQSNANFTVHFENDGRITRIVSADGQENTPGNLVSLTRQELRFLSSIRQVEQEGETYHRINWETFIEQLVTPATEPIPEPYSPEPTFPRAEPAPVASTRDQVVYNNANGTLTFNMGPDESYTIYLEANHAQRERGYYQAYGQERDPRYFNEGTISRISASTSWSVELSQKEKNEFSLKAQNILADYRAAYPDTFIPTFDWGNIKPTPIEIEVPVLMTRNGSFTRVKGTHTGTSLISYENGSSSSAETVLIELASDAGRTEKAFYVTFDAESQKIISITFADAPQGAPENNLDLLAQWQRPLSEALKKLQELHQLPKKLLPKWENAPKLNPPITLNGNDSSRFVPTASSLATTLAVIAIIYAGERSETMSTIGNGILDTFPLEKLHAYLKENAPILLEKNKITAATVATLAVIIDHLLTTTSKTRFEANIGQAAQLSLCGWATYRTVEKLLTPMNKKA